MEVKCKWPNVWTSAGKILRDETADVPDEEAARLRELGAVEGKRGRKKASQEDSTDEE